MLDERNYFAPFSQENPPRRVLDIATGTGRWAMEIGDEFPQCQIIGTDLSPIQPDLVNPNVKFYIDDACVAPPHPLLLSPVRLPLSVQRTARH